MTWRIEANRPSKHCSKMDVECMFLNSGGGSWSPAAEEACFWALCLMTREELRRESALRDKPSLAYNPPRSCSAAARPKFEAAFSPRLSLAITSSSRFTAPSWSCWSTSSSTRADHPCNNASDPSSAIATHLPTLSLSPFSLPTLTTHILDENPVLMDDFCSVTQNTLLFHLLIDSKNHLLTKRITSLDRSLHPNFRMKSHGWLFCIINWWVIVCMGVIRIAHPIPF